MKGKRKTAKPGMEGVFHILSRALSFAATPTFALMALLARVFGESGMHGGMVDSMALMYLLMSVFHATPWLKWLATRHRRTVAGGRTRHRVTPARPGQ